MYLVFLFDFISSLLLLWTFFRLWKERNHLHSLKPFLPGVILLTVGRLCDMMLEHPALRLSGPLGLSPESFEIGAGLVGNITDVIGISFLTFGFIRVIRHEREGEQRIRTLETLLPICSSCKKYRTSDDQWMPIEKYLMDTGTPGLTHGICPDCAMKIYGKVLRSQQDDIT
jgi:hypothetical protein